MKIKKTKRLLALILCMALVLGTNTFTMAAGAGQTQEENLQEQENISQEEILQEPEESSPEEAGTEAVQAQALEAEEIIEEEPQEEAQEQPQGEEIQKDSMGETEEAAMEDDGQGETAETNGEENVTEEAAAGETESEKATEDKAETTVPEDGTAESEQGSENTAQDNDQGKDSQTAEAGEKQENGTTAGEASDQEEIDEQDADVNEGSEDSFDYNSLTVEEIYTALQNVSNDEAYFRILDSLTEEKYQEVDIYIKNIAQGETVVGTDTRGIINALNAAPIYKITEKSENGFKSTGVEEATGLNINKVLKDYESGNGTLELEAFATGNLYTSTTPLDIVMILDQSGSMAYSFGSTTYIVQNYMNEDAYRNQKNLYVKVDDKYYPVQITREAQTEYVEYKIPSGMTYSELYDEFSGGGLYYYINGQNYEITIERQNEGLIIPRYKYSCSYGSGWSKETLVDDKNGTERVSGDWTEHLRVPKYLYTYIYKDGRETKSLGSSSGANQLPPENVILYKASNTALDALMHAVGQFANSVHTEAMSTGVDHRIAIAGFSSSGYGNTEILTVDEIAQGKEYVGTEPETYWTNRYYPTGYAMNGIQYGSQEYNSITKTALKDVSKEWDKITNAIGALTAYGGTQTKDGLSMAVDIFTEHANDYMDTENPRQKVAILFTDGDTDSDEDDVVETAKELKDMGVTVYTVGIFEGANGNITEDRYGNKVPESFDRNESNKLMHLVSSNYPDAEGYNWNNGKLAELEDGKTYFLSADDSDSLNEVFESIYQEVGGASNEELDETTVLYDEMSEYFSIDVEKKDDITVYRVPVIDVGEKETSDGTLSYEYTWGDKEDITDSIDLEIDTNGKIYVSNFDYSNNYVGTDNGNPRGYKLVLEIPIEAKDMPAFGGNQIPTNEGTSGIYNASGETCYGNFQIPSINNPIDYQIASKDQTIYITNQGDLGTLLDYAANYKPDGVKNAFVNITYTLKDSKGEKLGTLNIPAGSNADDAVWSWTAIGNNGSSPSLKDCAEYTLECVVNPSVTEPAKYDDGSIIGEEAITTTFGNDKAEKPTIHVVTPTINGKDTFIFLGEKAEFGENVTWTVDDKWINDVNEHTAIPTVSGTKPTLTITPVYIAGTSPTDIDNYYLEEDSDFTIKVEVGNEDITQSCEINPDVTTAHKGCIENDSEKVHDFTIHVVGGEIQIYKAVEGKVNPSTEGNAVFTFKVSYKPDESSDVKEVKYYTIEFEDNNNSKSALVAKLENQKKGIYTIEELDTQRYDSTTINFEGSTAGIVTADSSNKIATVQIGMNEHKGKQIGMITYTNHKNEGGSLTDTDVVINRFTYSDSEKEYTFKQEEPTQVVTGTFIDKAADFISGIFH